MINLTPHQQTTLKAQIRAARQADERVRLNTIYLASQNIPIETIEAHLVLSRATIYRYLQDYLTKEKTKHDTPPGKTPLLNPEETQQLATHLRTHLYRTVSAICAYVHTHFKISYTIAGMCKWLKIQGFRYKRPIKYPAKLSPEKQAEFLQVYEQLKAALKPDEAICFIDGVHPDHQTQSVHGWIYKGDKVGIPTTGKQKRLHFMGSVTPGEFIKTLIHPYDRINQDAVIDFLGRLADEYPNHARLYVILDRAGYHTSKRLKAFIESQSKLVLLYLPPYSPNLNVIERLWKVMREEVMYLRYYPTFNEFSCAVHRFFFETVPRWQVVLRGRLVDRFCLLEPRFVSLSS